MEEKKYLKWYNKVGYGSGDIAGNVVYAFLTSFVMIYLTDSVGLAAGIVGTLIAVSKLFDGFTDIFFGSMIDKTHHKMGKAKPWMLYGYIGCAITLVCCFAVPTSWGNTAQYAWFFIAYTLLNGVFYTANNIAYSALTSLITKNSKERVQMQILIARCIGKLKLVEKGDVGSKDLVYQAVSYVSGNFRKNFSLDDMARDLGVSKYVLSRTFSKTFHRNFNQYLNDARLNYACHRLENTNDAITNICYDSGFESQRTFNRVFKERYKVTPSEYRNTSRTDIIS